MKTEEIEKKRKRNLIFQVQTRKMHSQIFVGVITFTILETFKSLVIRP